MRVAMIGLGKLGLPVSYALASRGIDVFGYDPHVWYPPDDASHEEGLEEAIRASENRVRFVGMADAVNNTDGVVFVAVQTPHEPRFEGVTPLPEDRADFDYTYLKRAVQQVAHTAVAVGKDVTICVISTVLPGTTEREVLPLLPSGVRLVYNPSFIAMGTTVRDFLDPEFVLLGGDDGAVGKVYREAGITEDRWNYWPQGKGADLQYGANVYSTSIKNAELIKVSYNTFIGLKIAFANTLMEVAHKTGCDVNEVTGALKLAHRRLISPAYLDGGMGDGGGCHPRDNIALSWLARELDLSHDLFEDAMRAREDHARWLAHFLYEKAADAGLPIGILGLAYKPGSAITTGSAALLVKNVLEGFGTVSVYDPHVPVGVGIQADLKQPHVFLVGCKHPEFVDLKLPEGSVVIDPFRYIPDQPGVEVIRVGQGVDSIPDDRQAGAGAGVSAEAA